MSKIRHVWLVLQAYLFNNWTVQISILVITIILSIDILTSNHNLTLKMHLFMSLLVLIIILGIGDIFLPNVLENYLTKQVKRDLVKITHDDKYYYALDSYERIYKLPKKYVKCVTNSTSCLILFVPSKQYGAVLLKLTKIDPLQSEVYNNYLKRERHMQLVLHEST